MKIKAEHWINHNGTWYKPGQEYETEAQPAAMTAEPEPATEPEKEQKPRRGRKTKAE